MFGSSSRESSKSINRRNIYANNLEVASFKVAHVALLEFLGAERGRGTGT